MNHESTANVAIIEIHQRSQKQFFRLGQKYDFRAYYIKILVDDLFIEIDVIMPLYVKISS